MLKSCLHQQLIRKIGVDLIIGTTVNIVENPTTLFQSVFANNAKMRKENGFLILDQNNVRNASINT